MSKMLWIVSMQTPADQNRLLAHAQQAGADTVCIRSDNGLLAGAIADFHGANIKVFGWRWPAVTPGPHAAPHYYALDEAQFLVGTLMPAGLDGYIADIESDGPGSPDNDWDSAANQPLAAQFTAAITGAIAGGVPTCPGPFMFGLTAGCAQPTNNPNIPWATFVGACGVLYPQAYWRASLAAGPTDINGGTPAAANNRALNSWGPISAGKPLECMAGELDLVTAVEIGQYGVTTAGQAGRYVYADTSAVDPAVLAAIAAL